MHEQADYAYAFREIYRLADDLRKEAQLNKDLSEKIACLLWVKDGTGESIRTEHCTCTPKVRMSAKIPKKSHDPEDYANLMRFLQIPESVWNIPDEDFEVVRIHWPGFIEYVSKLLEEGKPLPPGVDPEKSHPLYSLTILGRSPVDHVSGVVNEGESE